MNLRLVRLYNDYKEVSQVFANNPYIAVKNTLGNPPERYRIEYNIRGLEQVDGKVVEKPNHLVEIVLTLDYPADGPKCRALTPVFHPNIEPKKICIADHWAAGESLVDIIVRIGEMICYQNYNIKSPLNGEAVKWVTENVNRLPLDDSSLAVEKLPEDGAPEEIIAQETSKELKALMEQKLKQEAKEAVCANCGKSGENISFQQCANGHLVCSDCIVECQTCGKKLCALCSLDKCAVCGDIVCDECQITCSVCNQRVCKAHSFRCSTCQNEICSRCTSVCPECHKPFCKDHFDSARKVCMECAKTVKSDISIFPLGTIDVKTIRTEVKDAICSNCGRKGEDITFQECVNGHLVCSDCIVKCQTCGRTLCVLCSFSSCVVCGDVFCDQCQTVCPICNRVVCKVHSFRCDLCQNEVCSQCISICPECHKQFCKNHFDAKKNRCVECAQKASNIRIGYAEPSGPKPGAESPLVSPKYCIKCGTKLRPDQRFCTTCGNRVSRT